MINGYIENLSLPWEERIGNIIRSTTPRNVQEFFVDKKRIDRKTLVCTLLKDGKPYMVNLYVTENSGMLKKTSNQIPGQLPHWIYEYSLKEDALYVKRTDQHREILKFKMIITNRDNKNRVRNAEYRELDNEEVMSKINVKRDIHGNIKEEKLEDLETGITAILTCDSEGRWLSHKQFHNKKLIMMQEYLR